MAAGRHPVEIASGVFWLRAGRGIRGSNVYFVQSGSSWVLIDTAWPNQGQLIKKCAESLFGATSRPASILLTHLHPDHAGSALELATLWNLPVFVHPAELALATGSDAGQYANPLDRRVITPLLRVLTPRARMRVLAKANLRGVALPFDSSGGVPELPDWDCIPTPGHTPGHVAFLRRQDRVLITGDSVLTVNVNSLWDLLVGKQKVSGPPRVSTWSWPAAQESMSTLAGLNPRVLASGHGTPMTSRDGTRNLGVLIGRARTPQ
jgi:glyoxylase-like metal-dependent hydrolase (beta-lactamase superfamily II)